MTLAGAFFSNRARTSAHIVFVTLTGVLGEFKRRPWKGWPLRPVTFNKRLKSNPKRSPLASGPSLGLGVPSLRHSSGGIAYGLLRDDLLSMCSATPNGAARHSPDKRLPSASRGGGWIKIKSCRRADTRPVEWWRAWVYSVGASLLAMAAHQPTNLAGIAPPQG